MTLGQAAPAWRASALELLDTVVQRAPQSVAVQADDATLTYAELAHRADRLARRLRRLGVGRGDLVGQCLPRSASLVVGALATLRAGAAYVAIDPAYPDERIRWMLDDARVAAVVTDTASADRVLAGGRLVTVLERGGRLPADADEDGEADLSVPPGASELAYVVYTSGSTGHPKGVMVEHGSLANLIAWHHTAFDITAADHCTQIASPGFDAAVWELWPTLTAGATLHVVPEELRRDPLGLRDWMIDAAITVSFVPTAVAEALIALPWPQTAPLRRLLTGGDALTRRPSPGRPFTLINNYGPSETTVVATSGTVSAEGEAEGTPAIGRPIAGIRAEVVDDRLEPVTPGATGELMIGGVALARGYLHRDDLTAERFITNARGRWYRTGDLVRERADGQLDFLGRADDQLSLRGFRVEPAEIVGALSQHPAVASSAVMAVPTSDGGRRLVAYLVAAGDRHPSDDDLAAFLGARLPEYMVPAGYAWLAQLPLTAHGKLDRERLQALAPPAASPATGAGAGAAHPGDTGARQPQTAVEKAISAVLSELLDVESVGLDENFFLLGGHSMLGAQLIVRLEDLFGAEISLRFLFDHPTLVQIADEVNRQTAGQAVS